MKRIGLSLFVLLILLAGCSAPMARSAPASAEMPSITNQMAPAAAAPMEEGIIAGNASRFETYDSAGQASPVDQLIIQNANISIVVADPAAAMNSVVKMTEEMKGFVVEFEYL